MTTTTTPERRRTTARRAALALAVASGLAIAGFTALGAVFDYPQILKRPTDEILTLYRTHQAAIMLWFAALAIGSALLAPAGVWLGRLTGGTLGRWIAGTGIAAAAVQVIGLQRWVFLVPTIAHDALDPSQQAAAQARFEFLHNLLGRVIGETIGYALTATFTILIAVALASTVLPRWLAVAGQAAAGLIATGVFAPVLGIATLTNFAGYVVWCAWLLALAWLLVRRTAVPASRESGEPPASAATTAPRPGHGRRPADR